MDAFIKRVKAEQEERFVNNRKQILKMEQKARQALASISPKPQPRSKLEKEVKPKKKKKKPVKVPCEPCPSVKFLEDVVSTVNENSGSCNVLYFDNDNDELVSALERVTFEAKDLNVAAVVRFVRNLMRLDCIEKTFVANNLDSEEWRFHALEAGELLKNLL